MDQNNLLVLLDEGAEWSGRCRVVAHWTRWNVSENQESIPFKTEENALINKRDYLTWVKSLGQYKVGGKTLTNSLKLFGNISFWWMTVIAVKSPYEANYVYTVFKLRELERLYSKYKCSGLIYCGSDRSLHRTLQGWCAEMGHFYQKYHIRKTVDSAHTKDTRKWLHKLPFVIQAFAYLIKKWYLRYRHVNSICSDKAEQLKKKSGVTIVTYFPNIDLERTRRGKYWSRYWENLHLVLDRLPFSINWVWLYFDTTGFCFREAVSLRDICNRKDPKKHRYFLLEEFLTPEVFFKILKLYFRIYLMGLRLGRVREAFRFPGSKMNFFPSMEKAWKVSLFGNLAMDGASQIVMFDSMAKTLPASPFGLFTWEGSPWETALISAWKKNNSNSRKSKVLAALHGFSRPLDLRQFSCFIGTDNTKDAMPPLPDKLAIHSNEGISLLHEAGFPKDKIAKVEALRYFGLKGRYHIYKKPIPSSERTLLLIMGYSGLENRFQFQLLKEAANYGALQNYNQILVKPHPGLSPDGLRPVYESKLNLSIKNEPLSELWPLADVVYGAHATGASWEASWFGIPTIIVGADNMLNLSPLNGLQGVHFVMSGIELLEQLKKPKLVLVREDYFFLNEDLRLWKKLLKE
jgi:surface carbohydrate biosynthesis protein (TIGR04326 family)